MSKQVEERVVSMQFDNSRFERNVSQSMSTLDKLKQKLNFNGASKGLENVQTAASKVDMHGLANNVETVRSRFSALEVMGVTALANITNSAVNAGKKMISALTIDPVITGFQEYETQMNAVQTILANTQSKGSTLNDVTAALDELNKYADLTIYNFTEMTRNIGTFTAAGVDLDTSVSAIQGIANLAAVSGSTSQQASTAMYQLSQALAAGTVKLMDWNSVVNAGMGGEVFQNALKETSKLLGTGAEAAIKAKGSFRESLTTGWLTSEVLTETLKKFTTSGANEYVAKYTGLSVDAVEATLKSAEAQYGEADAIDKAADALAKKSGKSKDEIKSALQMAKTAQDAATKVKTFSQLWDVMKEAAQSGWAKTWQLIIGDFEEAKALLTPLADFFTGVIGKMSDARNKLLESALGKSFTDLGKKISGIMKPVDGTVKSVKSAVDAVKDYSKVVNEIIRGDWGNGQIRFDKLTKAGYDWAHAQNLVNEKLGCSVRRATNYKEAQDQLTKSQEKSTESTANLSKAQANALVNILALSDAELKAKGYTDEQIKAFRELEATSKKLGIPIRELVTNLDKINGRWLLINSFKNIGSSIVKIFKAIGEAWRDAFPPMQADQLFNIIAGFHRFSTKLKMSDETAKNLTRTLKGVFAILDIILTIVGGPIKIAFKILTQILGAFDLNILDVTAIIGDAVVKFRNWLDSVLDFTAVFKKLAPYVKKATDAIRDWVEAAAPLDKISALFKKVADGFKKWIAGMKEADNVPQYIIQGLVNGLKVGAKAVGNAMVNIGKTIIESIRNVLGIHSPSKEMEEVGKWTIEGFIQGIQNGAVKVWNVLKNFGAKCIAIVKSIDVGAVLAAATSIGLVVAANTIGKALLNFSAPFEALGDFLEDLGKGVKTWLKADALKKKAEAIKSFAIAIGILVASVYVLTLIDPGDLWGAIGAIAALSVILIGLSFVISKLNGLDTATLDKTGLNVQKTASQIIPIAISLLLVASAVKKLAGISLGDLFKGGIAIAALGAIMVAIMATTKLVGPSFDKTGVTLMKVSSAILLLVFTMKQVAKLEFTTLVKGMAFMALFGAFVVALMAATQFAGPNIDGLGSTILKISVAILLLVFTARIIGSMDTGALIKGGAAIIVFGGIIAGLIAIVRIAGDKELAKVGSTIIAFSTAMLLMAFAVGILGRMELSTLIKGTTVIIAFGALIAALVYITKYSGNVKGLGTTILSVAIAIGILAAVSVLLGLVKIKHLVKGITAVGLLSTMMAGLIVATRGAQNCKGNLIVMTVAIAVLAAAIALLSTIDTTTLATVTMGLTSVMGAFALMIKMASSLQNSQKAIVSLLAMVGVVALLAGIIYALSELEVDVALETTAGLSLLMLSMSAALVIVSMAGKSAAEAFIGIGAFATLAVSLFLLVGVLACMDGLVNAIANAKALTLLVVAMSLMLIPLSLVGALGMAGLPFIGVGALATLAASLFIVVGVLATMEYIQNAEHNANLLTNLMVTMTKVLVALSIVGPLALIGVTALTAMSTLMLALGALAVAIGALMQKFPAIQSFLDTGIPVLVQLAGGIGKMIGAFVGGIMTEIAAALPAIGLHLSQFMSNAMIFITGAKQVDEKVLAGVGILAGAIIALTAADLITGVLSFLQGGSSFADLGTQLSQFMLNALPFITTAKMIDAEMITGVKTLAEAILVLTGANMLESITKFLGGESSLANFGSQLGGLGSSMKTFVTNLGTFSEDQVTTVNCAGKAIKALAEAASEIPNEGGWAAAILGDNSLASFGSKLPQLGMDLSGFINNLGTFSSDQVTTVNCAGKAIKALAEAASEIPDEGGLWSCIVGDNSLATFGSKLPGLGKDLNGFIENLGTFGEDKISTVNCAGKAIKALAEAADTIPDEGGLWSKIVGDNSLATFGAKLPGLAKNIASFVSNLGTFGEGQIATVNSACKAIKTICSLGKIDLGDTSSGMEKLGKKLAGFAEKLASFVSALGEIGSDSIDSAIKKSKDLIEFAKTAASTNVESLSTFGNSLKKVATDGVKGFVEAFTSAEPKEKVKKAADSLVKAFVKTVGSSANKSTLKTAGKDVGKAASGGMDSKDVISDAKEAGKNVVTGFADGIKNNKSLATNAGSSLGKAALKAAKEALDENSPSKEMYKVGDFAGVGFVNALYDNVSQAYKAGTRVADSAKLGISKAVARIADIVNSDIDAQPTIRPVLDLSDVRAGAGSINALFSGRTLAVDMAGVGAVSASMAGFQNGSTSKEIVSGIKALRKDIANMPRNTYTVNGVTYDDGTNVSSAVESLARAIKIERRT